MNAGFSNLATLKAQLLAPTLLADTTFDAVVTRLGLGVAAAIENFCNRKFARVAGATDIFPADRIHFQLNRYPIESISKIELKLTEAGGFVSQTVNSFVQTIDLANGMVYLPDGPDPGPYHAQLRFTYTGGYWWDTADTGDTEPPVDPETIPSGAAALPADLLHAWLLQCELVWKVRDNLGTNLIDDAAKAVTSGLSELKFAPEVLRSISDYQRMCLT